MTKRVQRRPLSKIDFSKNISALMGFLSPDFDKGDCKLLRMKKLFLLFYYRDVDILVYIWYIVFII